MEVPGDEQESKQAVEKPLAFHLCMLALMLMVFMVSWDATSLAVAIPVLARELKATTTESFWASIAFMLGVAVTQPIYASVSDVVGRKIPLYVAIILFIAGCILFALAENMTAVVAGRVLQGLGSGGLDVLQPIILSDITTLKERPPYLALMAVPIAVGTILGPIIGSLFAEYVTWRWIGWINLPFAGGALFLSFFFFHLRPLEADAGAKLRRLDWGGMALFTIGATCLCLPLSWADSLYPWSSWRTILPLVIGLLVLVGFGWYEKFPTAAMFPYRIFATNTARMALLGGFINGLVLYTALFYLPLSYQAIFLQSPIKSAIRILPFCCLFVVFSVIAPVSVQLVGKYRPQLWAGWVMTTLFLGLFCLLGATPDPLAVSDVFQAFLGAGLGAVFMTNYLPLQAAVTQRSVDDASLAAGLFVVFRLFGALIGLAIASGVFNSVFASQMSSIEFLPRELSELRDPSQAVGFIPELANVIVSKKTLDAVIEAYRSTFRAVWIVLTCLSGVGAATSLLLKTHTVDNEETGRQRFNDLEKR
ncbi:major facilitator superfamily domain-containing protein [Thelonectria olida]|uniref:Major facilitator superfamily domain-containing protein n=1 Tax=Thelonectria olida TaxID=1576542 RepID=A0A9P8W8W2_9HYPO|nr:major facilitator superfamily domain-containing protein [Thelonectria olida]